jgi:hypothetical protein
MARAIDGTRRCACRFATRRWTGAVRLTSRRFDPAGSWFVANAFRALDATATLQIANF